MPFPLLTNQMQTYPSYRMKPLKMSVKGQKIAILAENRSHMAILKLKDRLTGPAAITATALFLCASVFFFLPVDLAHKITIPVGILTIASLWLCPWQMTMAFLFSALGDHMGSCQNFLGQMGFFAVGHIWFIVYFINRYFSKVERDRKLTGKAKGYLAIVIFCAMALLSVAFFKIAPGAPAGIIRIGVCIYACLISTMFQGKIKMARGIRAIIGNLALDGDPLQKRIVVKQRFDIRIQFGDADHLAVFSFHGFPPHVYGADR